MTTATSGPVQAILASVPSPMLLLDESGRIVAANDPARDVFGAWIVDQPYAALRQPQLLALIETAYAHGASGEARFVQSGQAGQFVFRVTLAPIPQPFERGLALYFEDVTHLREAQEMRRDFVANVSHELRTPLTAILGFIETLRGPARDDSAAQARFLAIMEDEARRMNRIVSDLLSLSRVEADERIRPDRVVRLEEVIGAALAALEPQAEDAGNILDYQTCDSSAEVLGDKDQLIQVVLNLVENAVKYGGPEKPVHIRLSTAEASVKGPEWRLDVQDQGEGIDEVHLPRLTERFYRVDTHRSRAMGGTGLGLAIVKHIVNRHRGRVSVASTLGEGTTVSVYLPRHA